MKTYTIKSKILVFVFCGLIALTAVMAGLSGERKAEALSYSQTDFAIVDYESFEAFLDLKNNDFSGKTVRLYCDIDMSLLPAAKRNFTFSSFAGVFDGNGHVLRGCTVNPFGTITAAGTVKNVSFADAAFTTAVSLASVNRGLIQNVSLHGTQTASQIKGAVGENRGSVVGLKNCLDIVTSGKTVSLLVNSSYNNSVADGCYYSGSVVCTATKPYEVSYSGSGYQKTVDLTFNYLYVYPFSSTSLGTSTSCSAVVDVQTVDLPCIFYPYLQQSTDCSFIASFTATEDQPAFDYVASPVATERTTTVEWCSGSSYPTQTVAGTGRNVSVKYCDCNAPGIVLRDSGSTANVCTHGASAALSALRADAFDALSLAFADRGQSYETFFAAAEDLFALSNGVYGGGSVGAVSDSVVVGVNVDMTSMFRENNLFDLAALRKIVSGLFGFNDVSDFTDCVDLLADEYVNNTQGASTTDRLLYDGAVYTDNGSFVLPFVFKGNMASPVYALLIVDDGGDAYVWLGDVDDAVEAVDYDFDFYSTEIYAYGRCMLFETIDTLYLDEDETPTETISSHMIGAQAVCRNCYQTCYYNTATFDSPSYSSITKVRDENAVLSTDLTDLDDPFVTVSGFYPVPSAFITGAGTSVDPIVLSDADDFYALELFVRKEGSDKLYLSLAGHIDFYYSDPLATVQGTTDLSIDGNDYYLYNDPTVLFGNGFSVVGNDIRGTTPDAPTSFTDASTTDLSPVAVTKGTGTANDPYLIENVGQWVAFIKDETKNLSGKFAAVNCDLIVNSYQSHGDRLGLASYTLSAAIDGCGHTVYGLCDEALVGTIDADGKIANLTVYTVAVEGESADAPVCYVNYGTISDVTVKGGGAFESAFVTTNDGSVTLCKNYLAASYAFCADGSGTVSHSIDYAGATSFDGKDTGVGCEECVWHVGSKFYLLNGDKEEVKTAGYIALSDAGYDTDLFVYELGATPRDMPVLRRYGGEYKTESEAAFVDTQPNILYGETYLTSDFIDPDTAGITVRWTYTYNDVTTDITENDISDVGLYTLYVIVDETDATLPQKTTRSFEIGKADCGIEATTIDFGGLEFTYTGAAVPVAAMELQPEEDENHVKNTVKTLIEDYGFTFSYAYTQGGVPIGASAVEDVGTYYQTFTATSKNYKTLTRTARRIDVRKATVEVSVSGSKNVYYGYAASLDGFSASATFLGKDAGYSLQDMVANSNDLFITDYTTSLKAGSVAHVTFDVSQVTLVNYVLVMSSTVGTINVQKAPIAQGDIWFYDATALANGSCSLTYTGAAQTVAATNLPTDKSCVYGGDTNIRNAGNYTVTLTVDDAGTDDNYEALVLTVEVTVAKATLTLTAVNTERYYGYSVRKSDFSYMTSGFVGNDTAGLLTGEDIFVSLSGLPEGSVPGYGTYDIVFNNGEVELLNYEIVKVSGVLTITKVPLNRVYVNNATDENVDFNDRTAKTYDGNVLDLKTIVITYFAQNSMNVTVSYVYEDESGIVIGDGRVTNAGTYIITATATPDPSSDYSESVYTCSVTILKKTTSIAFTAAEGYESAFANGAYTYPYVPGGEVYYGQRAYTPFVATGLPTNGTAQYESDEAMHAGTYRARAWYVGDENHYGCEVTATLTVTPATADVNVTREYRYSGAVIVPVVEVTGTAGELTAEHLVFRYRDGVFPDIVTSTIKNAGPYDLLLSFPENSEELCYSDFVLAETEYRIEVSKLSVSVTIPSFKFDYGTFGEFIYTDANEKEYRFNVGRDVVTYVGYTIKASEVDGLTADETVNVQFRLQTGNTAGKYFPATIYTACNVAETDNFKLSFARSVSVTVERKMLSVQWMVKIGGAFEECLYNYFRATYTGESWNDRFSYVIDGFADGDIADYVSPMMSVTKQGNTSVSEVLTVGAYNYSITIGNRQNYYLDSLTTGFTVYIDKKPIVVYADDATVLERENFTGLPLRVSDDGFVGMDEGKTIGEMVRPLYVHTYDPSKARAGEIYAVTVSIALENYETSIRYNAGRTSANLTVLRNETPECTLFGQTFAYDGTAKSLTVTNLGDSTSVRYQGNGKVEVGEYNVVAEVTYPSGRVVSLAAIMKIEKATPVITSRESYIVYRSGAKLTDDMIDATATIAGTTNEVAGRFTFVAENYMSAGANKYKVRFDPVDTHNFNAVTNAEVTVKCFSFGRINLIYSGDYTEMANGDIKTSGTVTVTLNRANYTEITDRVDLFLNGVYTPTILLAKTETVIMEIRFDNETVYQQTIHVQIVDPKDEEKSVVIDEKVFSVAYLRFAQGDTIYVGESGGLIALDPEYADEYMLYVNGELIESAGYLVTPGSGTVTIEVRHRTLGVMYSKSFSVADDSAIDEDGSTPAKTNNTLYIILGVAGGALALLLVLLLLLKKH